MLNNAKTKLKILSDKLLSFVSGGRGHNSDWKSKKRKKSEAVRKKPFN